MININDNSNNTTPNQPILPIVDCSLVFTTALKDVFESTLSLSNTPMSPTTPTLSNLSSNSDHDIYHLVFHEKQDLLDSAENIIDAYVQENLISFAKPAFEKDVLDHTFTILNTQLMPVIENSDERNSIIDTIIEEALADTLKCTFYSTYSNT